MGKKSNYYKKKDKIKNWSFASEYIHLLVYKFPKIADLDLVVDSFVEKLSFLYFKEYE